MNLGADLKDARRRFPLAITAGMFTVVGLLLLLNFPISACWGSAASLESNWRRRPCRERHSVAGRRSADLDSRIPVPQRIRERDHHSDAA